MKNTKYDSLGSHERSIRSHNCTFTIGAMGWATVDLPLSFVGLLAGRELMHCFLCIGPIEGGSMKSSSSSVGVGSEAAARLAVGCF